MRVALLLVLVTILSGCALPSSPADAVCGRGAQPWLLLVTQLPGFMGPDHVPLNVERLDRDGSFLVVRGTFNNHYSTLGAGFTPPPLGYQNTTEEEARSLVASALGEFPKNASLDWAFRGKLPADQLDRACAGVAAVTVAMATEKKEAFADCGGHKIRSSLADGDHEAILNCQGEGPVSRAAYGALKQLQDAMQAQMDRSAPATMRVLLIRSNFTLAGNRAPMEASMGGHCAPVAVSENGITLRLFGSGPLPAASGVVVRVFEHQGDIYTVSSDRTEAQFVDAANPNVTLASPLPPRQEILHARFTPQGFLMENAAGPSWSYQLAYDAKSADDAGRVADALTIRDLGELPVSIERLGACA